MVHINRLQRFRKALARTVMHQRSYGSPLSSTALLHATFIGWRIRFKLATLAYKALGPTHWPATLPCWIASTQRTRTNSAIFLLILFCSLFHGAILSLARVLSESLYQRFGTHFLPIFAILHHSLLFVGISKHTIFSSPTSAPDDHPLLNAPRFSRDYDAL